MLPELREATHEILVFRVSRLETPRLYEDSGEQRLLAFLHGGDRRAQAGEARAELLVKASGFLQHGRRPLKGLLGRDGGSLEPSRELLERVQALFKRLRRGYEGGRAGANRHDDG